MGTAVFSSDRLILEADKQYSIDEFQIVPQHINKRGARHLRRWCVVYTISLQCRNQKSCSKMYNYL